MDNDINAIPHKNDIPNIVCFTIKYIIANNEITVIEYIAKFLAKAISAVNKKNPKTIPTNTKIAIIPSNVITSFSSNYTMQM